MRKEIIRQDIADLEFLVNMYAREKKFDKASGCLQEKEKLEKELKGGKNEKKIKLV